MLSAERRTKERMRRGSGGIRASEKLPTVDTACVLVVMTARCGFAHARIRACGVILFLDFDGVLHPDPCYDTRRLFEHAPRLVDVLNEFGEVCVVLSTSWRSTKSLDALTAPLPAGLCERVIGATPLFSSFAPPPHLMPYRRQAECAQWLHVNGQTQRDWIALDDRPSWFSPACEHLIACDSQAGFDQEAAGRLRSAFVLARQRMLRKLDAAL
jgi:hypothetical protein